MNSTSNQNKKYLIYDFKGCPEGLDNYLMALSRFLSLSFLLGRIPVITEFHSDPDHNFGLPSKVVKFEDYVDLSKTQLFEIKANRTVKQVATILEWVSEQDFDLQAFPEEQVRDVYVYGNYEVRNLLDLSKTLLDKQFESYTVVYIKHRHRENEDVPVWRPTKFFTAQKQFPYFALLQPSQKVEDLTDIVLDSLGTSRDDIISLKQEFLKQPRNGRKIIVEMMQLTNCFYACVHVRTAHKSLWQVCYYFASLRKQIKRTIQVANLGYNTKLYIMSDIHDPKYFDFLKSDYQVYRYYDFPELRQLVTGEANSVDNYMLYSVEKNIMSYALIQIVPPESNALIFPLDASYRAPFFVSVWHALRYHIPVVLKSFKFNFRELLYLRISLILKRVKRCLNIE